MNTLVCCGCDKPCISFIPTETNRDIDLWSHFSPFCIVNVSFDCTKQFSVWEVAVVVMMWGSMAAG